MITVKLQGGLGNQMFQYALGRSLADQNKTELYLDLTFLLDRSPRPNFVFRNFDLTLFDLDYRLTRLSQLAIKFPLLANSCYYLNTVINGVFLKLKILQLQAERTFNFDSTVFNLKPNPYFDGYWQSYKYFLPIISKIKSQFIIKPQFLLDCQQLKNEIRQENSVCVNIRRGDFVNNPNSASFHGFVGLEYYRQAVNLIASKITQPKFYIFSDEIEWCRDNLKDIFDHYPHTYIGHDLAGEKFGNYLDLMMNCSNFIIPNSSFAWWAAYLSANPSKIVIAPKHWFLDPKFNFDDLIPNDWIRI
jgi:hypothetical protein